MATIERSRSLTLQEAAAACGTSARALQRRVDRGTLRSVLVNDRRRVNVAELVRVGLLAPEDTGQALDEVQPGYRHAVAGPATSGVVDARELLNRLLEQERSYAQIAASSEIALERAQAAERRAEQERAEADRLREALYEAEARVQALELAQAQDRASEAQEVPLPVPTPPTAPAWAFWRR
jgi:hypothetical protein